VVLIDASKIGQPRLGVKHASSPCILSRDAPKNSFQKGVDGLFDVRIMGGSPGERPGRGSGWRGDAVALGSG
jgi:hypothetical protein